MHSRPVRSLALVIAATLAVFLGVGAAPAEALISTSWVQRNLAGTAYYGGAIDGIYGSGTRAAVTKFQADNCLVTDGIYGSATEGALLAKVKAVQTKAGTTADGLYGSGTTSAVKAWQAAHGLAADGIAGPLTMKAMGIVRVKSCPTGDTYGKAITRAEVLKRGQYWVSMNLPYSQTRTYRDIEGTHTYRTDCSGFVSMAWHASPSGIGTYWTGNMYLVTHPITKAELLPGDAILNSGSHVVLFAGWYDSAHTKYYGMEEGSRGAIKSVIPYPYWGRSGYSPVRYDKIVN